MSKERRKQVIMKRAFGDGMMVVVVVVGLMDHDQMMRPCCGL